MESGAHHYILPKALPVAQVSIKILNVVGYVVVVALLWFQRAHHWIFPKLCPWIRLTLKSSMLFCCCCCFVVKFYTSPYQYILSKALSVI